MVFVELYLNLCHLSGVFLFVNAILIALLSNVDLPIRKIVCFCVTTFLLLFFLKEETYIDMHSFFGRDVVFFSFMGFFFSWVLRQMNEYKKLFYWSMILSFLVLIPNFVFFVILSKCALEVISVYVLCILLKEKCSKEVQVPLRIVVSFLLYVLSLFFITVSFNYLSLNTVSSFCHRFQVIENMRNSNICAEDLYLFRFVEMNDSKEKLSAFLEKCRNCEDGNLYFFEGNYDFHHDEFFLDEWDCQVSCSSRASYVLAKRKEGKYDGQFEYERGTHGFSFSPRADSNSFVSSFENLNLSLLADFINECVDLSMPNRYVLYDENGEERLSVLVEKNGLYDIIVTH